MEKTPTTPVASRMRPKGDEGRHHGRVGSSPNLRGLLRPRGASSSSSISTGIPGSARAEPGTAGFARRKRGSAGVSSSHARDRVLLSRCATPEPRPGESPGSTIARSGVAFFRIRGKGNPYRNGLGTRHRISYPNEAFATAGSRHFARGKWAPLAVAIARLSVYSRRRASRYQGAVAAGVRVDGRRD